VKPKIKSKKRHENRTKTVDNGKSHANELDKETVQKSPNWADIWHKRFGHICMETLRMMKNKDIVRGLETLNFTGKPNVSKCEICNIMKATRLKFHKREIPRVSERLDLIHMDICGPITPASMSGKRYFITFVDDATRKSEVYFLEKKSEAMEKFKEFKIKVEKQTGLKIKRIRSDNGGEFIGKEFTSFLKSEGISHELTNVYSPEQNGIAERLNRTLGDKVRCMLANSGLPEIFWAEAVRTANFVRNVSSCRTCDGKTPAELWDGHKPSVSFLKIFGCTAYATIPKIKRGWKYGQRALKLVFLGYSIDRKGYRLWNPSGKEIIDSRDIRFDESDFQDFRQKNGVTNTEDISTNHISFDLCKSDGFAGDDFVSEDYDDVVEVDNPERQQPEETVTEMVEETEEESDSVSVSGEDSDDGVQACDRELRPRTANIRPEKYTALVKMRPPKEKGKAMTSEDCMFLYGPYPGFRIQ
jgi:hypothetical protein